MILLSCRIKRVNDNALVPEVEMLRELKKKKRSTIDHHHWQNNQNTLSAFQDGQGVSCCLLLAVRTYVIGGLQASSLQTGHNGLTQLTNQYSTKFPILRWAYKLDIMG